MITSYFDFEYRAIFDETGNTICLLHTATDVTSRMEAWRIVHEKEAREQALNEELATANEELTAINEEYQATNEELNSLNEEYQAINEELKSSNEQLEIIGQELQDSNGLLNASNILLKAENLALTESEAKALALLSDSPAAIGLLAGPELLIESANTELLKVWGKKITVINKPLAEALPELQGQPFLQLLEAVYASGQTYYGNEVKAALVYAGKLTDRFFQFCL